MNHNAIGRALAGITVGAEVRVDNLLMFPLMGPSAKAADYITLDHALAQNCSEITEVSEHGVVPELCVVNRGLKPTLIMDGEELVGAKQNWVVNLTILQPSISMKPPHPDEVAVDRQQLSGYTRWAR